MAWRAAVKIAYDGRQFMGSQRQPGGCTVEDEVIRCLRKIKAIESPEKARFRTASRTDRGVSALGNVVAFDTSFDMDHLLQALNSQSDSVFFLGLAKVPASFSPRRAQQRWYRYFHPIGGIDVERLRSALELFEGDHDFKRFCKPEGRETTRRIESIEAFPLGEFVVIDFRAREFLRNLIRRIVAASALVGKGKATLDDVREALEGKERSFGLAPSEDLVLVDVEYPFDFEGDTGPALARRIAARRREAFIGLVLVSGMEGMLGPADARVAKGLSRHGGVSGP
ncbi:MAG TPA: tRNA pseudouridine(38-40) synthase TruA [Methanomassiliicoccales archaeon]|nr:tRNA pseudouridine(38-40) synthase TruA [Methanomassiliicoccales archaeon]